MKVQEIIISAGHQLGVLFFKEPLDGFDVCKGMSDSIILVSTKDGQEISTILGRKVEYILCRSEVKLPEELFSARWDDGWKLRFKPKRVGVGFSIVHIRKLICRIIIIIIKRVG